MPKAARKLPRYKTLMATRAFEQMPVSDAIERIGLLIDASQGARRIGGLRRALEWADKLEARGIAGEAQALLDYFRANAWDGLRPPAKAHGETWAWENNASVQAMLCLRRARNSDAFDGLHPVRRCQILTNLGSELSRIGRAPEAIELWEEALEIDPRFWMARGNRAKGLSKYARYLYEPTQAAILFFQAHTGLVETLRDAKAAPEFGHPEALANFDHERRWIEHQINPGAVAKMLGASQASYGRSKDEQAYRHWCARNRLFLDPTVDASVTSITPADVLMLPSFVTKIREPPSLIGFFNQIKQEFASARYEYYLAAHSFRTHFSDRGVALANTLDYPSYGLAVERGRTSFRVAYSLFDKVAFFLNAYFKLGIKPRAVNFEHVWKEKVGKTVRLRRKFTRSKNPPLHALYWLSRDLFEGSMAGVLDPGARLLHEYRILLEHRYLKVHEMRVTKIKSRYKDLFEDSLAYSVSRSDLDRKTLRLLKLARSAIIYLSLAMHREELHRKARRRSTNFIVPQALPNLEDQRKL